jgi:hypothetical protein
MTLADFRDLVQRRYDCSTMGWDELILRDRTDEEDAFRRFWQLWDEFILEKHPGLALPSPLSPVA